ncbi:double zinc ribbon domain-containing protein [Thiovibrio sp. JS02]
MKTFLGSLLDLFFPPSCLSCEAPLSSSRNIQFCADCYSRLSFIHSPLCPRCGRLFSNAAGGDHLCSACLTKKIHFSAARALLLYEEPLKKIIHRLKYQGKTSCLRSISLLKDAHPLPARFAGVDLILPVPLHKKRLGERGFNQALLLAECFFPRDKRLKRDLLVRPRETAPQTGFSGRERRRNLRDAFAVPKPAAVAGKRILLIDDVFTTGTTVNECARTLKKAGAGEVLVLTLARVRED